MSLKGRLARIAVGVALAVGPIIGCGEDTYDSFGFGGSSGAFGTSSGTAYYPGDGAPPPLCDSVTVDASCYGGGISTSCERGTSANANCNPHLVCNSEGTWVLDSPQRAVCAPQELCPAVYTESAPSDLCRRPDAISLLCEYDEGTCGCAPVGGVHRGKTKKDAGASDAGDAGDAGIASDAGDDVDDAGAPSDAGPRTYEWKCVRQTKAGCPRERPREGVDCVRPLDCDYGFCVFEDGYRMDCYSGNWVRDTTRSEQCDQ